MPHEVEITPGDIFAVVCTEFHVVFGPYVGAKAALEAAKELSGHTDHACKFVPLPFVFQGRLVGIDQSQKGEKWSDLNPPGQYL